MAYIAPSTDVRILTGCPLLNDYIHTIYFASAQAQYNYFYSLQKYHVPENTYQRHSRNKIRVGISADNLFDCNYLMFRNYNFGTKWFYAFITDVEYVNNQTAEITYEIDVIQTWLFDYTRLPCYVVREHAMDDSIGSNITPEKFNITEYVFNDYEPIVEIGGMAVIILVADTGQSDPGNLNFGTMYDGIYSGAKMYAFNAQDTDSITTFLTPYSLKPDSIVGFYMVPMGALATSIPVGTTREITKSTNGMTRYATMLQLSPSMTLNGYSPRNNKLFTYPYNFYHVDNGCGQDLNLRYEFFWNHTPSFEVDYCLSQPVSVVLHPRHYKAGTNKTVMSESLSLNNYPLCSWAIDAYAAWVVQNGIQAVFNPFGYTMGSAFGSVGAGVASGNPVVAGAATANALGQVDETWIVSYKSALATDICKGNVSNGNIQVAHGYQTFFGARASIPRELAREIDDYFDMFGYATNKVKIPNISGRPHWNYIKTADYAIVGSIPSAHAKKISDIHNNGITYWRNGSEVGNYSLDNRL